MVDRFNLVQFDHLGEPKADLDDFITCECVGKRLGHGFHLVIRTLTSTIRFVERIERFTARMWSFHGDDRWIPGCKFFGKSFEGGLAWWFENSANLCICEISVRIIEMECPDKQHRDLLRRVSGWRVPTFLVIHVSLFLLVIINIRVTT